MARFSVFVKAEDVESIGNGIFRIDLVGEELSDDELRMVQRLLPNLDGRFYDLLSQEVMLKSLAPQVEVDRALALKYGLRDKVRKVNEDHYDAHRDDDNGPPGRYETPSF
jgi:hypothetical protein